MTHDRERAEVPLGRTWTGGRRRLGIEDEEHERFFALASEADDPAIRAAGVRLEVLARRSQPGTDLHLAPTACHAVHNVVRYQGGLFDG